MARRLLNQMLEGEELEEHDVRELVAVSGETLYVDFKDGAELDDSKKAARTVRQYTAGFANADGGILVIGVSDGGGELAGRVFTKTSRPGGRPLTEWARTSLEDLAGSLSPAPRIQVVTVEGVEVLLIGVARAPALVPCVESGELKYYLRLGDSTLAMPPYLISDLILGRREHPRLQVAVRQMSVTDARIDSSVDRIDSSVMFVFDVHNESMVPAVDVLVGVISWGPSRSGTPPSALRSFIDSVEPIEELVLASCTSRARERPLNLAGFETGGCVIPCGMLLVPRAQTAVPVRAALYAIASGHPPEWYQLDWLLPASGEGAIRVVRIERVGNERPVVAWNQEWRDTPDETTKE